MWNVKLQSQKIDAQLVGSITGELNLEMVPQDVVLETGDVILTSGLGGSYTEEMCLLDRLYRSVRLENDLFQSATVQPIVDFSQLQAVLIIKNFQPVDITPLIPEQVQ